MWYTYSHCSSNTISPVPRQLIMSPEQSHAMQMPGKNGWALGSSIPLLFGVSSADVVSMKQKPYGHLTLSVTVLLIEKKSRSMIKWTSNHQMIKVFILAEKDMMFSWSQKKTKYQNHISCVIFSMIFLRYGSVASITPYGIELFHAVPPGAVWLVSPWWIHGTIVSWTLHENHKH